MPEHTLSAYQLALAEGADGVECDVRLTRDGHLVCLHDSRLDRTSNGTGRVSTHSLAELNRLDFASWRTRTGGTDVPIRDESGRVLTLDRLITVAGKAGRQVRLLIETKHPTRYGAGVERTLVALLGRRGLLDPKPDTPVQVTVMSFAPLALRRLRYLAPTLPTVLLLEFLPRGVPLRRLSFGARIAGPSLGLVRARPALVRRLRSRGYQVYVWTVNKPSDIDLVHNLGVNGIITDRPLQVLSRLTW